jgi:hypothetical protein
MFAHPLWYLYFLNFCYSVVYCNTYTYMMYDYIARRYSLCQVLGQASGGFRTRKGLYAAHFVESAEGRYGGSVDRIILSHGHQRCEWKIHHLY